MFRLISRVELWWNTFWGVSFIFQEKSIRHPTKALFAIFIKKSNNNIKNNNFTTIFNELHPVLDFPQDSDRNTKNI